MNATRQAGCKWIYLQPGLIKHFNRSSGASQTTMCFLPPHCSHGMQLLGVSFMKPLSTYYDQ